MRKLALARSNLPKGFTLRCVKKNEEKRLWEIDKKADLLFEPWFPSLAYSAVPFEKFAVSLKDRSALVVANDLDVPVGFALTCDVEGVFWLEQMSVDPDYGQKGVGTALLKAVIERAKWSFYNAIALSTFKNVPFNSPFYEKFGFVQTDPNAAPMALKTRFTAEVPNGIQSDSRVLMVRKL